MKLSQVKDAQPDWFSRKNKKFFGDVDYRVLHARISGKAFLVRSTYRWSDMFGQAKKLVWKINELDQDTGRIRSLIDKDFCDLDSVKDWLKFC
jgi:hypothetical protein